MSNTLVPALFAMACGGIFVLALVGLGGFLLSYGVRSRRKAAASHSWPSTQGQIITSEVKQSISHDENGRPKVAYYPAVQYSYQVGGQGYIGKQISFGGTPGSSNPAQAQARLAPYPSNAWVTVTYNPENPAEATLERGAGGATWAVAVGAVLLAMGACGGGFLLLGVLRNLGG